LKITENKSLSIFKNRKKKTETKQKSSSGKNKKTETEDKVIKTNKAMKTKDNVQKTVLRSAAVIVSFVLISFTVAAQDFWKIVLTNSSFNQIALAMVEPSKKSDAPAPVSENSKANYIYENDYDAKLVVEDWMTDNEYFNHNLYFRVETERDLKVEDWMMNESLFANSNGMESPLALEDWMTNSKVWNN
jgi:hypothetical protein